MKGNLDAVESNLSKLSESSLPYLESPDIEEAKT